jgi:hypothetical protein
MVLVRINECANVNPCSAILAFLPLGIPMMPFDIFNSCRAFYATRTRRISRSATSRRWQTQASLPQSHILSATTANSPEQKHQENSHFLPPHHPAPLQVTAPPTNHRTQIKSQIRRHWWTCYLTPAAEKRLQTLKALKCKT